MAEKIGILGGTFDPVHYGHLRCAEEALEAVGLDRIMFIPSAAPPHKLNATILRFDHRWEMLCRAIGDHPRFEASDLERHLPGKSFTVVTLAKMHEIFPEGTSFHFLVGMDAFLELNTWWHYRELFTLASLIVLRRPGFEPSRLLEFLREHVSERYTVGLQPTTFVHPELFPVRVVSNTFLGISSTQIRQLVSEGRSIRYLVPAEVLRYIAEHGLYA